MFKSENNTLNMILISVTSALLIGAIGLLLSWLTPLLLSGALAQGVGTFIAYLCLRDLAACSYDTHLGAVALGTFVLTAVLLTFVVLVRGGLHTAETWLEADDTADEREGDALKLIRRAGTGISARDLAGQLNVDRDEMDMILYRLYDDGIIGQISGNGGPGFPRTLYVVERPEKPQITKEQVM